MKYLTTSKVAERLGLAQDTIKKYIQNGKIRAIKPGRDYLVSERMVEQLEKRYKK